MGMFSVDCTKCGHPALDVGATNDVNFWMNEVVALYANGNRVSGTYDGYGAINEFELAIQDRDGQNADVQHLACWKAAGRPEYSGPSRHSDDQGWFFEDGAHDMLEPRASSAPPVEPVTVVDDVELARTVTVTVARLVALRNRMRLVAQGELVDDELVDELTAIIEGR